MLLLCHSNMVLLVGGALSIQPILTFHGDYTEGPQSSIDLEEDITRLLSHGDPLRFPFWPSPAFTHREAGTMRHKSHQRWAAGPCGNPKSPAHKEINQASALGEVFSPRLCLLLLVKGVEVREGAEWLDSQGWPCGADKACLLEKTPCPLSFFRIV